MKLLKIIFILTVTVSVFLVGCSQQSGEVKIKSIEDVEISSFTNYTGTYVGDHNKLLAILNNLVGGETIKELDLMGEKIKVTYGKHNNLSKDKVDDFWINDSNINKNFYFNAIYLTVLVPNAKEYSFTFDNQTFSATREKMVDTLSKKFKDFPDDEAIWRKTVANEFLHEHQEEIEEMALDYE